jgi:hypothetical protein
MEKKRARIRQFCKNHLEFDKFVAAKDMGQRLKLKPDGAGSSYRRLQFPLFPTEP